MPEEGDKYDSRTVQSQGADALGKASIIKVTSAETWWQAREIRRAAKLLDSVAEKHYKQVKAPINKMRGEILALEASDRKPMQDCMDLLDPQILSYEDNEENLHDNLQAKVEADFKRLAEQQRQQELTELRLAGRNEQADELEKKPLYIPPVVLPDDTNMLDGEGRLEGWEVVEEKIDLRALAQAFLDGRVPESVIAPNMKVLNGMARTLKETFDMPGVVARKKRSITQR